MTDPQKPSLVDRIRGSLRISLAAWLAIGVGVSLIAITVFSWIIFLAEPQRVAWGDYLQWPQLAVLFLLWLSTCAATYWTVRLWTEDVPIREFDLEEAWQAGIEPFAAVDNPFEIYRCFWSWELNKNNRFTSLSDSPNYRCPPNRFHPILNRHCVGSSRMIEFYFSAETLAPLPRVNAECPYIASKRSMPDRIEDRVAYGQIRYNQIRFGIPTKSISNIGKRSELEPPLDR